MKIQKTLKNDQAGIASMVIVILIMTLLTLIVLGMTQNSNREQRQSLDRQLSSQAFYAAESGVADAKDYVAKYPVDAPPAKTKCNGSEITHAPVISGDQFPGRTSQVGEDPGIRYSCVLYNRIPPNLKFGSVPVDSSQLVPIEDAGGLTIDTLSFSWHQEKSSADFAGCPSQDPSQLGNLPDNLANNCEAGMLRVELINPEPAPSKQVFLDRVFLAYFKPSRGAAAGAIQYGSGLGLHKQGALVNGNCDSGECKVTIRNIGSKKLYLHLRSIYKPNSVEITGKLDNGSNVRFRGAQMEIDSTGRAVDLIKRISQRIPLTGIKSDILPEFVIQTSDDICKRLQIVPGRVLSNGC